MEDVIARIKEYVTVVYPNILEDLSITTDQLDFIVRDVVDRGLMYMNREQLVARYELDLVDTDIDTTAIGYELPMPKPIERIMAKTVVEAARTIISQNTDSTIKSLSDNGQSVTYGSTLTSFFNSSDDSTVFSSSLSSLRRYLIGNTIHGCA